MFDILIINMIIIINVINYYYRRPCPTMPYQPLVPTVSLTPTMPENPPGPRPNRRGGPGGAAKPPPASTNHKWPPNLVFEGSRRQKYHVFGMGG